MEYQASVVESSGDRVTWSYDNTSQLLSEQRSGANSYAHSFSNDEAGNRRTKKEDSVLTTFTFDNANQLKTMLDSSGMTTYTFDNNGNQRTFESPGNAVTTNTWDFENHLTVIEQPAVDNITYSYNPDGFRVEKNNQGTITKFIWDDQAYLAETDSDDSTTVVYSNEPSQFGDLISQRRSSNTNFFHFDALGSTRELTTSDESITDTLIYSARGEEINRTGATNVDLQYIGSQGYYKDSESDLFYIRARYLSSSFARWLSEDPLGTVDGMNLFSYVRNNPNEFIDPFGLVLQKPAAKPKCKKGAGTIYQNEPGCKNICEQAAKKYKNTTAGSVFCSCFNACGVIKCIKCACVFDYATKKPPVQLDFTSCPLLAKCACDHETSHFDEVACDKKKLGLEPAYLKPPMTTRQSECPKRRKDVFCIMKALKKTKVGRCQRTGRAWLKLIADYLVGCPLPK